jgi:hypothetical protein
MKRGECARARLPAGCVKVLRNVRVVPAVGADNQFSTKCNSVCARHVNDPLTRPTDCQVTDAVHANTTNILMFQMQTFRFRFMCS